MIVHTYQKKHVVVDKEGLSGDPAKIGYVRTHETNKKAKEYDTYYFMGCAGASSYWTPSAPSHHRR